MSQKFGIHRKGAGILTLLVSLWTMVGCDPCRQLAEEICKCKDNDEERRTCITNLGLAHEHKYFKDAKELEVCERALKECTCEKINDNQDAQCGMYRPHIGK